MSKKLPSHVDCACVIHGSGYDWRYVERLYNMLCRNLSSKVRMHVYTEHDRSVPPHMVKHILEDWGIDGPKRSWWYKMQLFNSELFSGDLLYFDLDVVLAKNLDWIHDAGTDLFWTIRDFRYLQRRDIVSMNSSMMWFNTKQFGWIWDQFNSLNFLATIKQYPGDQDYLNSALHPNQRRFFDDKYFESFRWQCLDGGYDFFKRRHHAPNTGVRIQPDTAVVVFHGRPKPAEVQDPVIQSLWR